MRAFFAKGTTSTKAVDGVPFFINNCGYYYDLKYNVNILRPEGRDDYQLIFVARGKLIVNGTEICSGGAYVFVPGERQEYSYVAENKCLYYWVHFCGFESGKAVKNSGAAGRFPVCPYCVEAEQTFRMLVSSYENNMPHCEQLSVGCVLSLLALVSDKAANYSPFRRAELRLQNCLDDVKICELAESFGMSEAHFIRSFKKYNGLTPRAYALKYRMEQAKMLLSSSDIRVSDVANLCGFPDALYFSRVFKKYSGCAPLDYRRRV